MNQIHFSIFILLPAVIDCISSDLRFDVMLERIVQHNGTNLYDFSKIRVRKFNRTISILDGTIELFSEADNKFELSVRLAYSSLGNNQFNESPMKIAPQEMCEFFNTTWRDYYDYFRETTNFPKVGECPIESGVYYVRNHVLDASMFPPYLAKGLWRVGFDWRNSGLDEVIVCVDVYFKVMRDWIF